MSVDKMPADKMSVNEMSANEMSWDVMTCCLKQQNGLRNLKNSNAFPSSLHMKKGKLWIYSGKISIKLTMP